MAKEIKHKITPEKTEKKLDQKIEKVIDQELDSDLDEKIKEIVDQKLEEKINSEVEEHLTEQTPTEPVTTEISEEPKKKVNSLINEIAEFKSNFHLCWRGSCRIVSLLTVPLYLMIAITLIYCHFTQKCNAPNGNIALITLFIIVGVATVSLILSFFSAYPKTALIFWILIDVPLLIIVFIFSAQYIALIILSLIITLRIIQISRGEY
jgi:hypothetical protein